MYLAMTNKAIHNKKIVLALTIMLISLMAVTSVPAIFFSKPDYGTNTQATSNQSTKQSSISTNQTDPNQTTNTINISSSRNNSSSLYITTTPISADNQKTSNKEPDPTQFFSTFLQNVNQDQMKESIIAQPPTIDITVEEPNNSRNNSTVKTGSSSAPILRAPTLLYTLNFTTFAYGGYLDQQPYQRQLFFSFPNNTDQGKLAGEDAITLDSYVFQKMDFDAEFVSPETNALGFDEMVIFAASDTSSYKGTEFGIRLDLSNGYIYGYIQEPNDNYGEVSFQAWEFMLNDGIMHHYTLTILDSGVSFCIDGSNYGYLNFLSKTNYSNLNFSILAVVHRFTDGWDSTGDYMKLENLYLN
jgi:hypothetical protein